MDQNKRIIKCPQCKREIIYSTENPYRPFCSERCRLIDLGQWANEDYKVPIDTENNVFDLPQDEEN
jgi:endogenous inhibitor of DNA gyrase (YacG/DUF329 family)